MIISTTTLALTLVLILSSASLMGQHYERKKVQEFYTPRHLESACPPDYKSTREVIDMYLQGHNLVGGPNLNHLVEDFGTRELTAADFEVLTDERETAVCADLRERFSDYIDRQIQICDGVDSEYLHDIAFYRTPDFNFVVFAGGILIQQDRNSDKQGIHISRTIVNAVLAFDKNWSMIYDRSAREMISRRGLPVKHWERD